MADKIFNTRIQLKYDTYANWQDKNPVLKSGEVGICVIPADTGAVTAEPAILMKVGDGAKTWKQLSFVTGLAGDVYSWAKASSKPTYTAQEISGLSDYISGEIQDTNTQYKIEADKANGRKFYLYSKEKGGDFGTTPVSTIEIPETVYTLTTGETNGTVKFNNAEVAVKGLGSAAYTEASAYDVSGAASGVQTALEAKIGTVTEGKTVVEMIAAAQAAATYDDKAVKASIKSNTDAIATLNGNSTVAGSVDKKVADAINEFATKVSDDQTVNTFKELIDYAASHQGEYSTLSGEVQTNKTAIATLNGKGAGSVSKAVSDAVDAAKTDLQTEIDKKVDAVEGKGLSSNDYTSTEKTKLSGIAEGAQVNVIEAIKVNGVAQTITSKAVDITVPTGALASKDKVAKTELADTLKSEIEGKVNSADCGDIISHNAAEFAVANHTHDISSLTQASGYIIFDCGSASKNI